MVNYMPTYRSVCISEAEKTQAASGKEFDLFRRKAGPVHKYDAGSRLVVIGKPGLFLRVLGVRWRFEPGRTNRRWRQWVYRVKGEVIPEPPKPPKLQRVRLKPPDKLRAASGKEFELTRFRFNGTSPYSQGSQLEVSGQRGRLFLRVLEIRWQKDPVNPAWQWWVFLVRGEGPAVSNSNVIGGADGPSVCQ